MGELSAILAQVISCSNVVLLVRTTSCFFILFPGKTSQHASQEMDGNGHSQWMGPGSPWTSTEVGEVARGIIRSEATDIQPAEVNSRSTARPTQQRARPRPRRSYGTCTSESIVERSRLRIKKLEQEREAEVEFLNADVQARLQEQVAAEPATTVVSPVTTNYSEEIARLKVKVAQLEATVFSGGNRSGEDEGREAQRWVRGRQFAERRASVVRVGRFQNVGFARCHRCGRFTDE